MQKSVTRSERSADREKVKKTYPAFSTMYGRIERLLQGGIPSAQIAVVTGSTKKDRRKEIAEAVNEAKIRVVFGSTDSLGAVPAGERRVESVPGRSRDSLDRVLKLTGNDPRAGCPYVTALPGQGLRDAARLADVVKAGGPGVGVPGGAASKMSSRPAEQSASGGINLLEESPGCKKGMTPEQVRARPRRYGARRADRPADRRRQGGDRAERGFRANGYVTDSDGVIHLVAPNLSPGIVTGVLLHEAFHSGVRPLIGDAAWTALLGRRQWIEEGLLRYVDNKEKAGAWSLSIGLQLPKEGLGHSPTTKHRRRLNVLGPMMFSRGSAAKAWRGRNGEADRLRVRTYRGRFP